MKTFLDGRVTLHGGDCLDVVRGMADNSIDSVCTDPPYALTSIVARYSNVKSNLEQPADKNLDNVNAGAFRRLAKGFMGKVWDTGDVAFAVEFWAEILRVLKPGGHVAAFGGTRSYHRLACAIEDAGFEIRDQLAWCYGTGFPKSHDVSKGIDKARSDVSEIRVICRALRAAMDQRGLKSHDLTTHFDGCHARLIDHWAARDTDSQPSLPTPSQWSALLAMFPELSAVDDAAVRLNARKGEFGEDWKSREITGAVEEWTDRGNYALTSRDGLRRDAPATAAARQWEGWGTALKPSYEPIVLGSKPLQIEQHIAILVQELTLVFLEASQWSNCNAEDVESRFCAILAKCAEASASVLSGARMRSLESIGIAKSATRSSISHALASIDLIRTKDCSALSHVAQFGNGDETSDQTTQAGRAGDFLKRLMAISTSAITEGISESTVRSWATISEDLLSEASKFTISTATKLTIALRTLNCSMLPSISEDTGRLIPNWSPICLARKPLSEKTVAANVLRWGTGAINVDGCRVASTDSQLAEKYASVRNAPQRANAIYGTDAKPRSEGNIEPHSLGRFPANLCHDGSDEVLAAFPVTTSGALKPYTEKHENATSFRMAREKTFTQEANSGSAARFFYSAKASKADRALSKHPTVKPVKLMQWLVRLITPPGGTVLDSFAGTGTTGEAAWREGFSAVLIEREEEYQADIERRMLFAKARPKAEPAKRASEPETLPLPFESEAAYQATMAAE